MDKNILNMTSTTHFLLPLLFADDIKYHQIINENFKSAYIADFVRKQYDDKILLVYDDYLINIPSICRIDSYKDDNRTILVYQLPDEFVEDYGKFLIGNFRDLSDKAKQKILNFWEEGKKTMLYRTLYGGKGIKLPEVNLHLEVLGL